LEDHLSDISLTAGIRSSVLGLQNTANSINKTQQRLSTGRLVNSALDNPTNFFASQANLARIDDLNSYKDGITQSMQVVKTADIGMSAMTSVFEQATAIAQSAMTSANISDLVQKVDSFNSMRDQVDMLSADSTYNGKNLLRRQDLTVDFGNNHTLTIAGADATSSGFDDMTNGLNVESASMDPLNIVDPNNVTTVSGAIKQDGRLTVVNNNVPNIDNWLGVSGVKYQAITSQDVTSTVTNTLSDGSAVGTNLLNNVAAAEYGTKSFTLSRDTTFNALDIGGSGVIATSAVNILPEVSQYLGPFENSGSKSFDITRVGTLDPPIINGTGTTSPPVITDQAAVNNFMGSLSADATKSFSVVYNNITQQWASPDAYNVGNNGGTPATSLSLDLTGSGAAMTVNLSAGNWANGDTINFGISSSWNSTDTNVKVTATGNQLSLDLNGDGTSAVTLQLSALATPATKISATIGTTGWKSSDPNMSLTPPSGGTGQMTVDLNKDGTNDLLLNIPNNGANGDKWLTSETINMSNTGPFKTTDPSVTLKYNDAAKTLGLLLNGNTGAPDITIDLSANWAVNNLSTSPLGNGDTINLTVDGRHRWVKGDGTTPNPSGMELSMSEIDAATNTLRMHSAINSSGMSILTARNKFIGNMVNTLQTGSDNLTLADMNEEGANMLMLQTRQSLGMTSLSQGSQASQSVLKLF
jgi:flagellin